jgi:ERCC4-type nuclease
VITISPAEPEIIKKLLGEYDQQDWPEDLGLDFAWITPDGRIAGVQRKKFPEDFLASKADGRLTKEIHQMGDVDWKFLVLEGYPSWNTNGMLAGKYNGNLSVKMLTSMLFSIDFFHDIRHHWTGSMSETVAFVKLFHAWSMKENHSEFTTTSEKKPKNIDWREWILCRFPDIAKERARAIINYAPEPLLWWNGGADLEKVPGIGKETAKKLRRAIADPGSIKENEKEEMIKKILAKKKNIKGSKN